MKIGGIFSIMADQNITLTTKWSTISTLGSSKSGLLYPTKNTSDMTLYSCSIRINKTNPKAMIPADIKVVIKHDDSFVNFLRSFGCFWRIKD